MENALIDDVQQPSLTGTLLFVDDEQNILSSLSRLFRPSGCRILTANSGKEGLQILENEAVDLIVSDMRMPEMAGDEFLEQVAEKWPDTMRILLTGYSDMTATITAINKGGIYRYISKPWEEDDLKITVQRALEQKRLEAVVQQQNRELKELNSDLESKVQERTAELSQTMGMLENAYDSLKKGYTDSVKTFSNIIEAREGQVSGHARRVANMARRVALAMGADKVDTQDIFFAGLLHDVGKIGLSDRLLNTPFDSLSGDDREKVIRHSVVGEMLLMPLEILREAAKIIHSHHERYDGNGYPNGLKEEEIPLGAYILAVVDDYDALQAGMLMSEKLTATQAQDFIVKNSGKRYAPQVVDVFINLIKADNNETDTAGEAVYTSADALREGMVLGQDLMTKSGMVLIAKGYRLDAALIKKIRYLAGITENGAGVYVIKNG